MFIQIYGNILIQRIALQTGLVIGTDTNTNTRSPLNSEAKQTKPNQSMR